jgi:hypothetical protein
VRSHICLAIRGNHIRSALPLAQTHAPRDSSRARCRVQSALLLDGDVARPILISLLDKDSHAGRR